MKSAFSEAVGACALVVGLAGIARPAKTENGFKLQGRTHGHCTLTNEEHDKELYKGKCTIKETIAGKSTIFDIKMGEAESFLFATADGGVTWMHGPEELKFRDHGDWGTFSWSDFRLEVRED